MEIQTGHVGMNVSNVERSKRFYSDVFGFELIGESQQPERRYAFLGKDQKVILTLWQQSAGRMDPKVPGLHHLSFQVASIDEVKKAQSRLKSLGVVFHYDGIVPHAEGTKSGGIFFEDPDGIRLEIFSPSGVEDAHAPISDAPSCGFF